MLNKENIIFNYWGCGRKPWGAKNFFLPLFCFPCLSPPDLTAGTPPGISDNPLLPPRGGYELVTKAQKAAPGLKQAKR